MHTDEIYDAGPGWCLQEDHLVVEENLIRETLFALGNGYLGLRGSHEERFAGLSGKSDDATFINGFYESAAVPYIESGYGWSKTHQFMLKVPNAKCINFTIDGEEFDPFQGKVIKYRRSLDFRSGTLDREVIWSSESGRQVSVRSRRVVSLERKNLFAIEYEIQSLNFSGCLTLTTALDARSIKTGGNEELRYGPAVSSVTEPSFEFVAKEQQGGVSLLVHRTKKSGFTLVSASMSEVECPRNSYHMPELHSEGERLEHTFRIDVQEGNTVRLTKYAAYFTSREHPDEQLTSLARDSVKNAAKAGFGLLCLEQRQFLDSFWQGADVQIKGSDETQEGIRFNLFHLLQSVGRDGLTSVAAKGLSGEGYGGHYFWDAETYAFPFYLYTHPQIARSLLEYRYSILEKARQRAREMSHARGALYPWRTISGEESSTYFPSGTAAYHINADIAYAVKQYYEATGDQEFLIKFGAEMVMETARIWIGLGHYQGNECTHESKERFVINEVTGPDEYTALVNNNFYTNVMAQVHLRYAADLAAKLKSEHPTEFCRLKHSIDLSDSEPAEWLEAAERMYLPYDQRLGVHPQDDSFLSKKIWDLAATPKERFPLAVNYHYLVIYRHQVCKQADVMLALLLAGDCFDLAVKKRDYDYYEAITTHDSSLSRCTFSILASEVGYHDRAYRYFNERLRGDLDNQYSDTAHGVHIAAMAGSWMSVAYGFGGMRTYGGRLQFAPRLPEMWKSYSFRIRFKSQLIHVEVAQGNVTYRLLSGDRLQFAHYGLPLEVTVAQPVRTVPSDIVAALEAQYIMVEGQWAKP